MWVGWFHHRWFNEVKAECRKDLSVNMVIRAKPPGKRTCNRIRTSDLHPSLRLWYLVRYESADSSVILKAAIRHNGIFTCQISSRRSGRFDGKTRLNPGASVPALALMPAEQAVKKALVAVELQLAASIDYQPFRCI